MSKLGIVVGAVFAPIYFAWGLSGAEFAISSSVEYLSSGRYILMAAAGLALFASLVLTRHTQILTIRLLCGGTLLTFLGLHTSNAVWMCGQSAMPVTLQLGCFAGKLGIFILPPAMGLWWLLKGPDKEV